MAKTLSIASIPFLLIALAAPATADEIDSLKGQFAFDWHKEPDSVRCAAVDDALLATFKSAAYSCSIEIITNTASGEPARVCTETGEGAEYLIFSSKKACEDERETQASNSE